MRSLGALRGAAQLGKLPELPPQLTPPRLV